MIDLGKKSILGVGIHAIDYACTVNRIVAAAQKKQSLTVSALAVHGVMSGALDPTHRYRLNHLDLVVPDGQPVRWALNLLHRTHLRDRVYGPTLMLKICQAAAAHSLPIYLYGSQPQVLKRLQVNLLQQNPKLEIAGAEPSLFRQVSAEEKAEICAQIAGSGASLVFVGLGCPRQEVWVYEHRQDLPMPLLAVGAAFDFHAGTLPQAPPILQRYGLEWAFRLVQEPRRLWRRYLKLNPLYLSLLFLQATRLRRFDSSQDPAPTQELRYG